MINELWDNDVRIFKKNQIEYPIEDDTFDPYMYFLELIARHPNRKWNEKPTKIKLHKGEYNSIDVLTLGLDGVSYDMLSLSKCYAMKQPSHNFILSQAYRNAIQPQIDEVRKYLGNRCCICKIQGRVDVDHISPFVFICKSFEDSINISPDDIEVKSNSKGQSVLVDPVVSRKFSEFHKIYASYQPLCEKCHISKTTDQRQNTSICILFPNN